MVVVWVPLPVAWDSVAVRKLASGKIALTNEDFPTPDCPTKMLVCPVRFWVSAVNPASLFVELSGHLLHYSDCCFRGQFYLVK